MVLNGTRATCRSSHFTASNYRAALYYYDNALRLVEAAQQGDVLRGHVNVRRKLATLGMTLSQ